MGIGVVRIGVCRASANTGRAGKLRNSLGSVDASKVGCGPHRQITGLFRSGAIVSDHRPTHSGVHGGGSRSKAAEYSAISCAIVHAKLHAKSIVRLGIEGNADVSTGVDAGSNGAA